MAKSIANLNVRLSADISRFTKGLSKAAKGTKNFVGGATKIATKLTAIGGAVTAAAGIGSLGALTSKAFGDIDRIAKFSDQTGLATQTLAGLEHGAALTGASIEKVRSGLQRFTRNLGQLKQGETTSELQRGLSALNLEAGKLAGMSSDQALRTVASGLQEISDPAARAAASYQLFGKSGQDLALMLSSGAEGIDSFIQEADKLGLTFDRSGAAKAEIFNDSLEKLQAVFTGVGRSLAIELAPYLTAVTDHFTGMATSGEGMGSKVLTAFEWVATGIAKAADFIELFKAAFYGAQSAASYAIGGIIKSIGWLNNQINDALQWIFDKLEPLIDWLPDSMAKAVKGIGQGLIDVRRTMADTAEQLGADMMAEGANRLDMATEALDRFNSGARSQQVTNMFAGIRNKADEAAAQIADSAKNMNQVAVDAEQFNQAMEQAQKNAATVAERIADLQASVDTFGMSDAQKLKAELEALGAGPDQIAKAVSLQMQVEGLELAKQFETPLEKYESQLTSFNDLLDAGAINWDIYSKAVQQAREQLESTAKVAADPGAPDALEVGSAAAHRFVYEQQRASLRSVAKDTSKAQLAEAETQSKRLKNIEKNTRPTGGDGVTVVEF